MSDTLVDLPLDAIAEILARTPVKSLLRFKCVCKSWYSLIRNHIFIDNQLRYASSNEDNYCVILKHRVKSSYRTHVLILSDKKDAVIDDLSVVDVPSVFISFFDGFDEVSDRGLIKFYGPCNGVVCVVGHLMFSGGIMRCDQIALWNPSTREMKLLPPSNVPFRDDNDDHVLRNFDIGFGYDFKSNDYKVVRILCFYGSSLKIVEIYNLRTDSWRKLDVVVPEADYSKSSIYFNGFYYWWSEVNDNDYRLISFDFADEIFDTIPPPDLNNCEVSILRNFSKSLAIFSYESKSVVVWVMNMDNGRNTWAKLFTFGCPTKNIYGFFRNGNVLIRDRVREEVMDLGYYYRHTIKIYDPSSRQFRNTWLCDAINSPSSVQLVNYVESLVSFRTYELYQHGSL